MAGIFLLIAALVVLGGTVLVTVILRSHLLQQYHPAAPELSLLLVVYNQAPIIEGAIRELLFRYSTAGHSFELVVYDDGSTDDTLQILRRMYCKHNIESLYTQQSRDVNAALDAGFEVCRGRIVHYFLLVEKVDLRTVVSLASCLSRGEEIPDFGVICAPGVASGIKKRSDRGGKVPYGESTAQ